MEAKGQQNGVSGRGRVKAGLWPLCRSGNRGGREGWRRRQSGCFSWGEQGQVDWERGEIGGENFFVPFDRDDPTLFSARQADVFFRGGAHSLVVASLMDRNRLQVAARRRNGVRARRRLLIRPEGRRKETRRREAGSTSSHGRKIQDRRTHTPGAPGTAQGTSTNGRIEAGLVVAGAAGTLPLWRRHHLHPLTQGQLHGFACLSPLFLNWDACELSSARGIASEATYMVAAVGWSNWER
jgi:hypothetical protein